jgi:hypothetical protein
MPSMLRCLVLLFIVTCGSDPLQAEDPAPPAGMKLVYSHDFEDSSLARYQPTDQTAWKILEQNGNRSAALIKRNSDFKPKFRSPFNRTLIRDLQLGTFVMDIRLQSTIPDYGHRDLCLFFGCQDDEHLYYVHFGKQTDDHANQIFIVNNEPRKKISVRTTPGTPWTDGWHHARIERNAQTGEINVWFDDLKTPVMTAVDTTFAQGRLGFGSFDDIGNFDDIRIYAP